MISIAKSSSYKAGYQVLLKFQITQHCRDAALLRSLVEYLDCGSYRPFANQDAGNFVRRGNKIL